MEFSPQTRRLAEKLMNAVEVPDIYRERALNEMAKQAEPYAKKNGHHFIRNDDFIEAAREVVPPEYRAQALEAFKKAGIDTDKEFPEWK